MELDMEIPEWLRKAREAMDRRDVDETEKWLSAGEGRENPFKMLEDSVREWLERKKRVQKRQSDYPQPEPENFQGYLVSQYRCDKLSEITLDEISNWEDKLSDFCILGDFEEVRSLLKGRPVFDASQTFRYEREAVEKIVDYYTDWIAKREKRSENIHYGRGSSSVEIDNGDPVSTVFHEDTEEQGAFDDLFDGIDEEPSGMFRKPEEYSRLNEDSSLTDLTRRECEEERQKKEKAPVVQAKANYAPPRLNVSVEAKQVSQTEQLQRMRANTPEAVRPRSMPVDRAPEKDVGPGQPYKKYIRKEPDNFLDKLMDRLSKIMNRNR